MTLGNQNGDRTYQVLIFSIQKSFSISIITKQMSICKPQNRNCYKDIYYLDLLSIGNSQKIIILPFCIEQKFRFDRARPRLVRMERQKREVGYYSYLHMYLINATFLLLYYRIDIQYILYIEYGFHPISTQKSVKSKYLFSLRIIFGTMKSLT